MTKVKLTKRLKLLEVSQAMVVAEMVTIAEAVIDPEVETMETAAKTEAGSAEVEIVAHEELRVKPARIRKPALNVPELLDLPDKTVVIILDKITTVKEEEVAVLDGTEAAPEVAVEVLKEVLNSFQLHQVELMSSLLALRAS